MNTDTTNCRLCKSENAKLIAEIKEKPEREINIGIPKNKYLRKIYQCQKCQVYFNFTDAINENLYEGEYNNINYGDELFKKYSKIRNLPEEKSDNKQRVLRVIEHARQSGIKPEESKVLDIGSGLCVFLGEMISHGFKGYCIDPDKVAIRHAIENVKVSQGYHKSFRDFQTKEKFEIISFNKVLEHVTNPISFIKKASTMLNEEGFIYIELPDAENALKNGSIFEREEFFIDHRFIFNTKSLSFMIDKAGMKCGKIEHIHDPSDKYTICAIATRREK